MSTTNVVIHGCTSDEKDQYGCVKAVLDFQTGTDLSGRPTTITFSGTSRKPSKALAYALESLAEYLKKS